MRKDFILITFLFLLFIFVLLENNNYVNAACGDGGGATCAGWGTGSFDYWPGGDSCTPHSCTGCTPAIPAGYTSTNNGCSVTTTRSCTGSNGCKSCTITKTRWLIETNVAESMPTSLSMIVDGQSYALSSNASIPTTVKYPSTENNVQISIPEKAVPFTASALGYAFRSNTPGLNIDSTNNKQDFPSGALQENTQGQVGGMYYTVNQCNTEKLYSPLLETYYKVDNLPVHRDVCDWDSSILASNSNCKDPETGNPEEVCIMLPDQQCTKEEFLPSVGSEDQLGHEDSTTLKGCHSEVYTGIEVNNPLKVRVSGSDIDGVGDIKGAIVWFNRTTDGGVTPALVEKVETGYSSTNAENIGILVLQDNNSWNNDPILYGFTKDGKWAKLNNNTISINGDSASIEVLISKDDIKVGSDIITFEISLNFKYESDTKLSGMYNFKSIVLDKYMIMVNGKIDQSRMQRYFNWGIDLRNPSIDMLPESVIEAQKLYLNFNAGGTGSDITNIVINGYKDVGLSPEVMSLESPTGYSSILPTVGIPSIDLIGHLSGEHSSNSWNIGNINTENYLGEDNILINIGFNEGGAIILYTTVFDRACNTTSRDNVIDLRPWIATKGGVIYSEDGISSEAKNLVIGEDENYYSKDGKSTLKNFTLEQIFDELTSGTELVSSREEAIRGILYSDSINAVRANYIYDSNDRKSYWFEYFKKKLELQREGLEPFEVYLTNKNVSTECKKEDCLMYSEEDIEIPSGYTCDRNTLFMSEKDIIINPNVLSSNNGIEGCIFIAKNKIVIKSGEYVSSGIVEYDYIEGFLIAEDQIIIDTADEEEVIRDGLEIKGGMVAFGRDAGDSSALLINRNLRLFNYYNPTLVMTWNVKYAKLSEIFFGRESSIYKQEVGFKAY